MHGYQYWRLRNPCLKTTRGLQYFSIRISLKLYLGNTMKKNYLHKDIEIGYLLTLRGPSPGEPAPPRMHVPTHFAVHDSAFLDLGRWILAGFLSSPAQF